MLERERVEDELKPIFDKASWGGAHPSVASCPSRLTTASRIQYSYGSTVFFALAKYVCRSDW